MPNGAVSVSPSSTTTSSAGMPSSWLTIWAQVVSWPCPWVRAPVRTMALPVMCTSSSAESPAALPGLGLLTAEVLVADRLQPDVEALDVLAGVGQEAERGPVREVLVPDEVHPPELRLVHAQVIRCGLHHPFLEEHGLGNPERTAVGDPARRLVAVGAAG